MLQQSCTYSKVRVACEQISIRESKMLFSESLFTLSGAALIITSVYKIAWVRPFK